MNLEDKNIREILLNGEEAVSPQVWAGVARGLDKAAAASRRRVVILWSSVASFAAAAAIAAMVVLLPGRGSTPAVLDPIASITEPSDVTVPVQINNSKFISSSFAWVTEPSEVPVAVAELVEAELVEAEPVEAEPAEVAEAAPEESPVTVTEPSVPELVAEPVEAVEGVEEVEVRPTEPVVNTPSAEPVKPASAPTTTNPFALLMAEENRIGNKPAAVTIGGLAQAGRASAAMGNGPGRAAPAVPQTGIRETGESRFELPLAFGAGLRFPVVPRLSIGAGINYTRLARSFTGTYTEAEDGVVTKRVTDANITQTQHYVGVPVNVYYDVVNDNRFIASVYAGATVERCLDIEYRIPDAGNTITYSVEPKGLQPSVAAGVGLQYKVLPKVDLYAEPGIRYYFDAHQEPSLRTMQPWMLSLELGLRYDLVK